GPLCRIVRLYPVRDVAHFFRGGFSGEKAVSRTAAPRVLQGPGVLRSKPPSRSRVMSPPRPASRRSLPGSLPAHDRGRLFAMDLPGSTRRLPSWARHAESAGDFGEPPTSVGGCVVRSARRRIAGCCAGGL